MRFIMDESVPHSLRARSTTNHTVIPNKSQAIWFKELVSEQTESAFFQRLSLDVRILIYEQLVIAAVGEILHVILIAQEHDPGELSNKEIYKLVCQPCIATHDHNGSSVHRSSWGNSHNLCKEAVVGGRLPSLISLLLSCRRMYNESIKLIYTSVTFSLINLATAERFFSTVPSSHLNSIRCLQLSYLIKPTLFFGDTLLNENQMPRGYKPGWPEEEAIWKLIWSTISSMRSLTELKITIYMYNFGVLRNCY
ncbi:hypothetical protein B0O99DRAFT_206337 [Bisporella sp. PMI_857]|nr:hypothetical protein B0O99DRAFT_206337 [Bisporella sp. PMI_857]